MPRRREASTTPTVELGGLVLESGDDSMPVATRSMNRRRTQERASRTVAQAASRRPQHSTPVPGPSRRPQSTMDESDSDSSSDSDDDNDNEASQRRAAVVALWNDVSDLFSNFEPENYYIGWELQYPGSRALSPRTAELRRLAILNLNKATSDPDFLRQLLGDFRARQRDEAFGTVLVDRMIRRLGIIQARFEGNQSDVIDTAASLRAFAQAADQLRTPRYWRHMNAQSRSHYGTLLLGALSFVVQNDRDVRMDRATPAYARQSPEQNNLYRNLITGQQDDGAFIVDILDKIRDVLSNVHAGLIRRISDVIDQRHYGPGSGERRASPRPSAVFVDKLRQLVHQTAHLRPLQ